MTESLDHELDLLATPIGRGVAPAAVDATKTFGYLDNLNVAIGLDSDGARICVSIGKDVIWGSSDSRDPTGVRFDHNAWLEFFAENWAPLWLEGFPANVVLDDTVWSGTRPFDWTKLSKSFSTAPAWIEFQGRHCISNTILMAGERNAQPEWWLVASDGRLHLAVPETGFFRAVPLGPGMNALERCCNRIAEWIAAQPSDSGTALVEKWRDRRSRLGRVENVRLYTGLRSDTLVREVANDIVGESIAETLNHRSPILAVARMRPARIGDDDLRELFSVIANTPKHETRALDDLTDAAIEFAERAELHRFPPYAQGQDVASWLRRQLGYADDAILDPRGFLMLHDVQVESVRLGSNALDAIAFWGPNNGPGVVTNENGRFAKSPNGARATLAHEICHLLVDRRKNLPLADVVGGTVSETLEKRARAFAAELLLPQRVAYGAFEDRVSRDASPEALDDLLGSLMQHYSVSRWIAGHQLRNSIRHHSSESPRRLAPILAYLDRLIARPLWDQ